MNILQALEQQIVDAHPTKDRAAAFALVNELRMMDCGHVADITIPEGETPKLLDTLHEIGNQLPLKLGSVRVRALRMTEALTGLLATLEAA